ncbi:hypothetical protein [Zavarzinella formosa]|uniref:hypothetical protein n=1 Tax=Zavarzinella formosa TaxID=360055 RepID=UPI0012F989B3|nr:hypothetical protein [Zavarzinella formosa]
MRPAIRMHSPTNVRNIPDDGLLPSHPSRLTIAEELPIDQAGQLLDWLESHGIAASKIELTTTGRLTVRWWEEEAA